MSEEESGGKPRPLNPDEILSKEDLDKIGESVVGSVDRPTYRDSGSSAMMKVPPAPQGKKGDIIGTTFSPTTTVPDYLRGTFEQLGSIQRWLHSRDLQKIQRAQIKRLTKELFEYQYKDMQHLMMLGMDIQKKQRFAQYLASTRSLQNEIQQQSAEAQLAVINTLFDNMVEAFKNKNDRDREMEELRRKGIIDDRQYQRALEDNDRYIEDHLRRIDDTAKTMIIRHGEFLHETLELFQTKLIGAGHL